MRQTKKLVAARAAMKKELPRGHASFADEDLYGALERRAYWWDSTSGEWKNTPQPSTSVFKTDDGNPSGILRVRLMGMPSDIKAWSDASKVYGWTLIEVSDAYPNRKGPGVRHYLTYKRD